MFLEALRLPPARRRISLAGGGALVGATLLSRPPEVTGRWCAAHSSGACRTRRTAAERAPRPGGDGGLAGITVSEPPCEAPPPPPPGLSIPRGTDG